MAIRPKWILILGALAALESTVHPNPSPGSSSPSVAVSPSGSFSSTPIANDFAPAVTPAPAAAAPPTTTSNAASATASTAADANPAYTNLAMASYYVSLNEPEKAEPFLVTLLDGDMPESLRKTALFELGNTVRAENDLPRAQSIYTQFLARWPADSKVPEVLLHQGQIFRQMGLNDLALGKFYSVMTSALALKDDQFAYYQQLVLETQVEIAETHYMMGQYSDAADFYLRLLQNADPALNRELVQFHLVRSLCIIGRNDQAIAQGEDFVARFPDSNQVPETRYYIAESLKALGRNAEALQQVLLCLQEQKDKTSQNPQLWSYWQQRIGNEIGNDLYHEGDYVKALEVYMNLEQLDPSPSWQLPVEYQMGMTYEKLLQPEKAAATYQDIVSRQNDVGINSTPALQAVFDMAKWRINFIQWQTNADAVDRSIGITATAPISTNQPPGTVAP